MALALHTSSAPKMIVNEAILDMCLPLHLVQQVMMMTMMMSSSAYTGRHRSPAVGMLTALRGAVTVCIQSHTGCLIICRKASSFAVCTCQHQQSANTAIVPTTCLAPLQNQMPNSAIPLALCKQAPAPSMHLPQIHQHMLTCKSSLSSFVHLHMANVHTSSVSNGLPILAAAC